MYEKTTYNAEVFTVTPSSLDLLYTLVHVAYTDTVQHIDRGGGTYKWKEGNQPDSKQEGEGKSNKRRKGGHKEWGREDGWVVMGTQHGDQNKQGMGGRRRGCSGGKVIME